MSWDIQAGAAGAAQGEEELRMLWRRFKSQSDSAAKDRLILTYAPLVKYVAGRMSSALPSHVEERDLISYGLMGLIGAVDRFDPERRVKFETYAVASSGPMLHLARGGWDAKAVQRLETWRISSEGRWEPVASAPLSAAPGELRRHHDLLLARSGWVHDLFGLADPASPVPLPVVAPPGCYGGNLDRGDGDLARGLWLPLGEYGAVRVGP